MKHTRSLIHLKPALLADLNVLAHILNMLIIYNI